MGTKWVDRRCLREEVYPLTERAIPKMLFSRTLLGGLASRNRYRCYDNAEIVRSHALRAAFKGLLLTQGQVSCRHLAGFLQINSCTSSTTTLLWVIIVTYRLLVPRLELGFAQGNRSAMIY